jgi:hypothetical protein
MPFLKIYTFNIIYFCISKLEIRNWAGLISGNAENT